MARLNRSDDTGANREGPGRLSIPQGRFRTQQDVIGDSLLQLGGRGEVEPGAGTVNDPLNAPFVLYVDPYIGDDAFVGGNWASESNDREEELRRIELQRLRCGYTEARPFRTINRAIIEAGLITSKAYFTNVTQDDQRVCIVLKPGVHTVLCGPGNNANNPGTLANDDEITFTDDQLRFFNPNPVAANGSTLGGGVILPRGCSMVSLDLRKTILRPEAAAVPAVADEAAPIASGEYATRTAIFRVTGEGYYYGFTFMDAEGEERSHHLLSCFEFATIAQLAEFYGKLNTVFQNVTSWDNVGPWDTEGLIVGEQPIVGQDQDTDTTASASPYIYNCSIRSEYGLCGIFANRGIPGQGTFVGGFGSMVVAQYTGVSLQKDMNCWERFTGGAWAANPAYNDYINNTDPDDLRMDPNRRSFHVRAVNRAVIQEVSVFAIGQGIHHWVESGGELTVTNSNSNFGGCSALAEGFQPLAYPVDTAHGVDEIKRATDLTEETNNIRRIFIGTIDNTDDTETTTVELTADLTGDVDNQPDIIGDYTLRPGSQIWVEVPNGADYRTTLGAGTVWDADNNQNQITIGGAFQTDNADRNNAPGSDIEDDDGNDTGLDRPSLNGLRLYIRRLVDTRTVDERRYSLVLANNNANSRTPQRDYIIQPRNGEPVYNTAPNGGSSITSVLRSAPDDNSVTGSEIELKRIQPDQTFDQNRQYLPGDPLTTATKHLICVTKHFSGAAVDLTNFEENFVHMEEAYDAEDYWKNVQPILLFDNDQDQAEASITLGYILDAATADNVWTGTANIGGNANQVNAALIQGQYRWATDYLGLHQWMVNSGNYGGDAAVHALLAPRTTADRMLAGVAEEVAFRRPSNIRLYSHAFEWAGFSNYTKAIPQYQGEMTGSNKFTFYATDQGGGRVYFTGFNEEGFGVSNRGVENLQTGEIVPPEAIDAPDREIEFPTFFDNLEVNNLTVNQSLTSPGTNNFQNSTVNFTDATIIGLDAEDVGIDTATTTEEGIGDIASAADLRSAEVPGGTDAQIDAVLDARGANFVTVAGLNYWRVQNGLLTRRPGVTVIFVAPDSATTGSQLVFNGAAAVELTADPGRSDADVLANPPDNAAEAVTFERAATYANTVLSELETAEYRLANGPYWRRPAGFQHRAFVTGSPSTFPDTNVVANYDNATTSPTTNVQTVINNRPANLQNWTAPIFGTGADLNDSATLTNRFNLVARPVSLIFNKGGSINGCMWLGVEATFLDTTNYPNGNGIFAGRSANGANNSLETGRNGTATFHQIANARMAAHPNSGTLTFDRYYGLTTMYLGDGNLSVVNCVFGAKAANFGSVGYGETGPIVRPSMNSNVTFRGIYMLGNVISTNATWATAATAGVTINAKVLGRLNCGALVDGFAQSVKAFTLAVQFPFAATHNISGPNADRNLDVNCIHILNNNGHYGRTVDDENNDGTAGAAMEAIIGRMPQDSQLFTGGYRSYQRAWVTNQATGHHGFAGRLGQPNDSEKTWGIIALEEPQKMQRFPSYANNVFQMATDGEIIGAGGTATPAPGTSALAYSGAPDTNPLNIRSRVFARGIDVNTANQNASTFFG